jgi:hypothetical protein
LHSSLIFFHNQGQSEIAGMGKKDKKGEGSVTNRELFQRMNFLYQAAMYMATITVPQQSSSTSSSDSCTHPDSEKDASTGDVPADDQQQTNEGIFPENSETRKNMDMDMDDQDITRMMTPSGAASGCTRQDTKPSRKLSRRKKRELTRQCKNNIAMEQISNDRAHHGLTLPQRNHRLHPLSGTGRFYVSTLREIGRKSVIRM